MEPPISEPVAIALVPDANEAAEPPDDPPGVNSGFQGFRVTPHNREFVYAADENSGVAVRAWTMPPARSIRSLPTEVSSATKSLMISEPLDVGLPLMKFSSLMPIGSPSSARVRWPEAYFASAFFAFAIASSK